MPKVPLSPPPGINKDDSTFAAEGAWADSDGFRFVGGRPETIGGAVEMAGATGVVRVTKMLVFDDGGTLKLAVAGDTLRVGALDAASSAITPAANWSADGRRRCLAMWGDILLAHSSGEKLFESAAGATATAVANAPTQSTAMVVTPSRQVMLLGTQEEGSGTFNGRCIRWSDIEDRTSWTTSASNNAGEYILPGQEDIVGGCVLGDYIMIWTEGSMWLAQFVGDPGQTFVFERVADIGVAGLDAFAIYRQSVYWLGQDLGFYAYQVGGIAQKIPCPLARHMRDWISPSPAIRARIHGCSNTRFGEVWFALPMISSGAFSQECRTYFAFCVDESQAAQRPVWFLGSFATAGLASASGAMIDSPILWDGGGAYKTQVIAHGFEALGNTRKPFRWDCGADTLGISGSFIQTADFYLDQSSRRMMIRRFIPDFDVQGGTISLTLFLRDRPMSSPVTKGPYAILTTDTKEDLRASGKIAAAKFSIASAVRVRLGKPLFDVVPLGER